MHDREAPLSNPLEGFRNVEAVEFGPVVKKDALLEGVPCTFLHTQVKGERNNKLHTFRVGQKLFSLWGSARLDGMLRAVKPNTYIFLKYLGEIVNADQFREHSWQVMNGAQLIPAQRERTEMAHAVPIRLLGDDIDRARASSRGGREPIPPAHEDTDFPGA